LVGGNLSGLVSELASKRNADGSSAATGLRKVIYIPLSPFDVWLVHFFFS